MNPIRVAIVEDQVEIREGIEFVLNNSEYFVCVGVYSSGEKLLENILKINPAIVLMDIGLPGMNGIECLKKIKELNIQCAIVMLTVFEDDEKVFKSILTGADGYLLKKTPPTKLVELLNEVHNGGAPMNPQIARRVLEMFRGRSDRDYENLSNREIEILNELVKGYNHKQISDKLFISPETVRGHLKNIYRKLHVHSKTEALTKVFHIKPFS